MSEESKELVARLRELAVALDEDGQTDSSVLTVNGAAFHIEHLERCRGELAGALGRITLDANGSGWGSYRHAMETLSRCAPAPTVAGKGGAQ